MENPDLPEPCACEAWGLDLVSLSHLVVGLLFLPSIESELDVRRRAADFLDLDHDLRAPPGRRAPT